MRRAVLRCKARGDAREALGHHSATGAAVTIGADLLMVEEGDHRNVRLRGRLLVVRPRCAVLGLGVLVFLYALYFYALFSAKGQTRRGGRGPGSAPPRELCWEREAGKRKNSQLPASRIPVCASVSVSLHVDLHVEVED